MFKFQFFAALLLMFLYAPISTNAQCVSTMVTSPNGENPIRITVGDGVPDIITFEHTDAGESPYAYAITDQNFNILSITTETENSANFDGAGEGACWVWGFSYTGDITASVGDFVFRTQFSTGCWQISRTALNIIRTSESAPVVGQLFASSNNQGLVGVYSFLADNATRKRTFPSGGADADGIYYDVDEDVVYQLSRSVNAVQAFSSVNASGLNPMITATSSMDFSNGREIAVTDNKIVVAQDANDTNGGNKFFIYDYSSTEITLEKVYDADINLWGIHVEGNTIYAIEDNTNRLAIYEDFFNQPAGAIASTRSIEIEGIVRTHGITYYPETDMMLLTDVGAASSPTDGTFSVVKNFTMAAMDDFVSLDEQVVVAGEMSLLGNPVDIAFDDVREMIFIAERANNGGRILGFSIPTTSGDAAPNYIDNFAGASAVYFSNPASSMQAEVVAQIYASSNNSGMVGIFDLRSDKSVSMSGFPSVAMDADGIFYDTSMDVLYQLNRSDNVVNSYGNVSNDPMLMATSSSDFSNGREIAISGNKLVVAQDANDSNGGNRFLIYDYSPNSITLEKVYEADINLWGIHLEGSTMYAIEDNTDRLAIYENFFDQPAGAIASTRSIQIEGIVRTHGITYDRATDVMYLTDVGAASSPTDGTFSVVTNFMNAAADDFVSLDEQIVVAGDATFLGNPVDIAYDSNTDMIFIAERANGGGRILGFANPMTSGNIAPDYNSEYPGASAVYSTSTTPTTLAESLAQIYASSNNSGMVGIYDIKSDNSVSMSGFPSEAMDADGIFYDAGVDVLYQLNRSDNVVNAYSNASSNPTLMASSSADSANGREIAVSGSKLVVAQDATDTNGGNKFFIYNYSPIAITLDKVYDADINLWGIHLEGSTMYAIEDNTDRLAIYEDFFNQPAGAITSTRSIQIEGIIRTHGITYDPATDIMYLTDVGAASSATDGTFSVIANFTAAAADDFVSLDEQIVVAGDATFLGNPVDIAYDSNSDMIFIAERANGGGRILGFFTPTMSGNIAPDYNSEFMGASAVYSTSADTRFVSEPNPEVLLAETIQVERLQVFPNPTNGILNISWESDETATNAILRVFNLQGQEVMRQRFDAQGFNQTAIDASNLLDGIYQVTLEYNDKIQQQRFIKQ